MKKLLAVMTAVLMILALTVPCFAEPVANVVAIIITSDYIEDKDVFTFCAVGNLYGNGNNEPFTFSVEREKLLLPDGNVAFESASDDVISEGMALYLTWGGEIMESYPMQLGRVHEALLSDSAYVFAEGEYDEYYHLFYWSDEDVAGEDVTPPEHIATDIEPPVDEPVDGEVNTPSQEPAIGETTPAYNPNEPQTDAGDIGEVSGPTVTMEAGISPWVFVSCIAIITVSIVLTVYLIIAIKANLKK